MYPGFRAVALYSGLQDRSSLTGLSVNIIMRTTADRRELICYIRRQKKIIQLISDNSLDKSIYVSTRWLSGAKVILSVEF
jgi:hypothetical protein